MDDDVIILTDEEDGKEYQFQVLMTKKVGDDLYYVLMPLENNDEEEYVILKCIENEDGTESLVSIDDDEEFDRVSDAVEDELFIDDDEID